MAVSGLLGRQAAMLVEEPPHPWPTPRANEATGDQECPNRQGGASLKQVVQEVELPHPWPTPMAGAAATETNNAAGNNDSSRRTEELVSGWATPVVSDSFGGRNETSGRQEGSTHHAGQTLCDQVMDLGDQAGLVEGWATPTAHERTFSPREVHHGAQLANQADLVETPSPWPTPKAQEDGRTLEQYEAARLRGYEARKGKTNGGPASEQGGLAIAAQLAASTSGPTTTSSAAATASKGALDAAFSRWLQSFPQDPQTPGWDTCSPGWREWDTVRRLLGEYSSSPEPTASGD